MKPGAGTILIPKPLSNLNFRGGAVGGVVGIEQINMRKVDGWQTLATNPIDQQIDLAASFSILKMPEIASR